jgi:hypothetical protein
VDGRRHDLDGRGAAQVAIRIRRRAAIALAIVLPILLALAILWLQRAPIASGIIARELERRGVPGRYRVAAIGPRTQVLEDIAIGDPAHPDLTARRAEVTLYYGFTGIGVRSIVAEGVRLRGRVVDGKISLGAVDRLMPAASGAPFALPDFAAELKDVRIALDTPAGPLAMLVEGRGKLSHGFHGRLQAMSPRLSAAGCTADQPRADVTVTVADRAPHVAGPVIANAIACAGATLRAPQLGIDTVLTSALDGWKGSLSLGTPEARSAGLAARGIMARANFAGNSKRTEGTMALGVAALAAPEAKAGTTRLDGRFAVASAGGFELSGHARSSDVSLSRHLTAGVVGALRAPEGTPIGPIGAAIAAAIERAAAAGEIDADLLVARRAGQTIARIGAARAASRSGALLTISSGRGIGYDLTNRRVMIDTALTAGGGGFPDLRIQLTQAQPGGAITGEARMAPYAVPGARLALDPVRFVAEGSRLASVSTRLLLDGPIGDGRVTGLAVPLSGRIGGNGRFALAPGCVPVGFERLAIAGMILIHGHNRLCPLSGDTLLRITRRGILTGGAAIDRPRFAGTLGGSPITLAADRITVPIDRPGFAAANLAVRLGAGADPTRLDVATIAGDVTARGIGGRFEGAQGKIGNVPLVVGEGAGDWSLSNGAVKLAAALTVTDAQVDRPRFRRMLSDDFTLALVDGAITAGGHLKEPKSKVIVAAVDIRHQLGSGAGHALLDVPGITFRKALQPDQLTPLTLGIVANVAGTVSGRGEIRWNPQGVTSDGTFTTERIDLAAAFGPVTGLKGTIRFSDLLGLQTPPGQVVTIAEVNPGVAATDGTIRYQLLPNLLVKIEGGDWPFAGGSLELAETVLDFSEAAERRLTFKVDGLDAGRFLQQLEFENVSATGLFDGTLPMIFDKTGGRIAGGRLVARKGGGTLAYVGEVSNAQLGTFGKMAFDALKSIRYQNLAIELNGPLDGEIVSNVIFMGVNQAPLGGGSGFTKKLIGLPFRFNIAIRAPFRGLVNTSRTFADPSTLIRSSLPTSSPAPAATTTPDVQRQ